MTVALVIADFGLVVSDYDLGGAADLGDGALDGGFGNIRGADSGVFAVIYEENLVKDDFVAFFVVAGELLNANNVPF